jgi:hypothetical protein
VLLRCYADLRKVITSDVSSRDDLDRHGRLRSDAAQGTSVRTQKWHDSRYVRLKARSANLVLILDILIVWFGDAFYRTGGSSWVFWM